MQGRSKATQVSTRGKGVKRPLIPSFDSDYLIHSQDSDTTNSDSDASSEGEDRQPPVSVVDTMNIS